MNYIYFYSGNVPDYVEYSINSILSVDKDAKIYFCSDKRVHFKNVEYCNIMEIESDLTKSVRSLNIYKNTAFDPKINNLWLTSLLRIFYLKDFMDLHKKENFIHFDTDVIIYKPFSDLQGGLDNHKLNITEYNKNYPIFGYSFFPNVKVFQEICKTMYAYLDSDSYINDDYYKRHPLNEMEILGKIKKKNLSYFNTLPSLPYDGSPILFDPSTYGQFFDGTHQNPKKIFQKRKPIFQHRVGQEISSKRIYPKFINNKPTLIYKDKTYEIANLHIHSKRLKNYLPEGYKTYT